MEYKRQSNGFLTFLEHYWFLVVGLSAALMALLLNFFSRLTGKPWIWCYALALFVAGIAVSLLFYAKLPLYRQRRFFTVGSDALPPRNRIFYRWGYRCAAFAVALLLCLWLSKP